MNPCNTMHACMLNIIINRQCFNINHPKVTWQWHVQVFSRNWLDMKIGSGSKSDIWMYYWILMLWVYVQIFNLTKIKIVQTNIIRLLFQVAFIQLKQKLTQAVVLWILLNCQQQKLGNGNNHNNVRMQEPGDHAKMDETYIATNWRKEFWIDSLTTKSSSGHWGFAKPSYNTTTVRDRLLPAQKLYGHSIQDILPIHQQAFSLEW